MSALEPLRLFAAAALLMAYACWCLQLWRGKRRQGVVDVGNTTLLLAFASQSGFARELAENAARQLRDTGLRAESCALNALDAERLATCGTVVFIASTCGEGDAPDNASRFERLSMAQAAALADLRYGLLALGDRSYEHFCGFGRRLDAWLQASQAQALFPRLEVDRADARPIADFHQYLASLAGISAPATGTADTAASAGLARWQLRSQQLLNAGSTGTRLWRLEFAPCGNAATALPDWQAGDLFELHPPQGEGLPRLYSIASLPAVGVVQLLLREVHDAQGEPGLMSALLTRPESPGLVLSARIRPHPGFRLEDNAARPLILIGGGSGLAGLLAHLRQRSAAGDGRNWLLLGERNRACDHHHEEEFEALAARDLLVRQDFAFSRDRPAQHVQDCLRTAADSLREWLAGGAAIYVCGSATGLGPGVHACLIELIGEAAVEQLIATGRYRRDLF